MTKRIISVLISIAILSTLFTGCTTGREKAPTQTSSSSQKSGNSAASQGQEAATGVSAQSNGLSATTGSNGTSADGAMLLSASAPPALDNFLRTAPDKIGTPGKDFPLLEAGEASDWGDIPVPLVNPLGSKKRYQDVKFKKLDGRYTEMSYIEGTSEVTRQIYGQSWQMRISDKNLTTNYLRWYSGQLKAKLYDNADDRITFSLIDGDQLWWATALWKDPERAEAILTVVRQDILPVGRSVTIRTSDLIDGCYYFTTLAGNSDFYTAFAEIAGSDTAQANISAFSYTKTGLLTRSFGYGKRLEKARCQRYALDDIPQTDDPLFWKVQPGTGKNAPESITIHFEKSGGISPVSISDRMGGIRVIGAAGSATVTAQSSIVKLVHEDGFSYSGIVTSDGSTLFTLPAGYYNIRTSLPGKGSGGIRMVPVNGGELTEVVLPDEFKSTYSSLESLYGNFNANKGSISILDNKDGGNTATVSLLVNDPLKRDIFPEKENVTITESGSKAEILDIKRETAPVNVVLILDTSGSMKDFMNSTVNAAKKFVNGLPDTTNIRLVSFASNITEHKGSGKNAVLKALGSLKANGGTALYDAADKGLAMLKGMENAYIVVFADGADSRELKGQGKGSTLTRDKIVSNIKGNGVAVLTIGFGEGQDPAALVAMSNASGKGAFFSAADETALDQVFAAVAGKFGNQFVITYKRPEILTDLKSEQPVVGVMMDDSGSMGIYRDASITMFHDFFFALPEGSLTQFSKFASAVDMMHITTDQKASLMQAMGEQGQTGSSTEIIKALNAAVEQLRPLPTNKKAFIFMTDSAMGQVESRKDAAETVYRRFQEEGIRCLFVGVSDAANSQKAFQAAAAATGGDYIITGNIADVKKKLDELLQKVSVPMIREDLLPFSIGIKAKTEDGSVMDYYAAKKLENFAKKTVEGKTQEPRAPKIITGGRMPPVFDKKAATLVAGNEKQGTDATQITSHISYEAGQTGTEQSTASNMTGKETYGITEKNKLVEMTVKDAYTFFILGGVKAKSGKQFLALNVEISFPSGSSDREAYKIPSIFHHFYLSMNNGETVPASKATWLTASPLAAPGETGVTVKQGGKKDGILVFYTEKPETVTQLALHFYDTQYGHIQLPLAGKISDYLTQVTELPTRSPAQISDAFSLSVTGMTDTTAYGNNVLASGKPEDPRVQQNTLLRTIQVQFDSKVQALFRLNPKERFYYAVETTEGPLLAKMNDVVYNMPLGFTGDVMLAPASSNKLFMPFEIPSAFSGASSYFFGDVNTGIANIPVTSGKPVKTSSLGAKFSHQYFDVTVNSLSRSPVSSTYLVLDITVKDKKDGSGTKSLGRAFALENTKTPDKNRKYVSADNATKDYLYGIDQEWAVFDDQTRRGIILFNAPDKNEAYVLRSPYCPDMAVKVENKTYGWPALLSPEHPAKVDKEFSTSLDKAVSAAVAKYKASRPKTGDTAEPVVAAGEQSTGTDVPAPSSSVFGGQVLKALSSEQDFYHMMYALKWLPADTDTYFYAPESVLVQGWGTEKDLAVLAQSALAGLGIKSSLRETVLTRKGKDALAFLCGIKEVKTKTLPAVSYLGEDGRPKVFVIPFMRDISELSGLLYLPSEQKGTAPKPAKVTLSISASAEGTPESDGTSQANLFGAFGKALGTTGSTEQKIKKDISLFSGELSIPSLSLDPLDIGYYSATRNDTGAELVKAVVDTTDGLLQGDTAIDLGKNTLLSVTVKLKYGSSEPYVHTTLIKDGQKLTDICHTLAFGLPEMNGKSAEILQQASEKQAQQGGSTSNNASKVKWYARNALYRYITAHTSYDNETAKKLKLVMGRVSQPMAVMVTAKSDGTNAAANFDLIHPQNQILAGEKDNSNAYRLFSGMYASILEGEAMADGKGTSLMTVWKSLPSGTNFLIVQNSKNDRTKAIETMTGKYPEVLVANINNALSKNTNTVFIVPKAAGKIDGKDRWAWLEIDSKTYDAISVFDTGEHEAEYTLGLFSNKDMQGYVGYFIGMSCATWAVSGYRLELTNDAEIRKAAATLCADILSMLEELMGIAESKGPKEYLYGKIKDMAAVGDENFSISVSDLEKLTKEPEAPGNFSFGFRVAVEVFFGLN